MFPAAHCCNPGSSTGSTSAGYSKEPLFRNGQRHGRRPDKSDLAGRTLVCQPQITSFLFLEGKAFHLPVDYLPVNRVFQVDNVHNRIMLCPVLFFCKT